MCAWSERRWIAYLQARNSTVPAVSEKLCPPPRREPLTVQTRYWSKAMAAMSEPLRCIYTGGPLDRERFHLDHFLPWTFVCHNSLWNLLPVSPKANTSKWNRLPDASYLPAFAASQHTGLIAARRGMLKQVESCDELLSRGAAHPRRCSTHKALIVSSYLRKSGRVIE